MDGFLDIPLYLQIATRLRHQIASAELGDGDTLPSLREGAERWGVNLHTVRRAYQSLAEEGLVETRRGLGSRVRVAPGPTLADHSGSLDGFVDWVAGEAARRFGVSASELADRLRAVERPAPERVWVLECSESLASSLADQIGRWSGLDARPWMVADAGDVPDGYHVATYYHYAEVRRAFAGRRRQPAFFGVKMEEGNLRRLTHRAQAAGRLVLLSVDGASGSAIASEVAGVLGRAVEIDLRLTRQPRRELRRIPPAVPVLLSPENWDRLGAGERGDPRLFELALQPDARDLFRIAEGFGWRVVPPATVPSVGDGVGVACIAHAGGAASRQGA
jgi:GntR family transcriptional regulator